MQGQHEWEERVLALLLGLRYRQVVALKQTYVIVITLWVLPHCLFSDVSLESPYNCKVRHSRCIRVSGD